MQDGNMFAYSVKLQITLKAQKSIYMYGILAYNSSMNNNKSSCKYTQSMLESHYLNIKMPRCFIICSY